MDAADQQSTGRRLGFIPLSPRSSPEGACANSVSGPHMCRPQRHARIRLSSPKLSGPASDWWRSNQPGGGHGGIGTACINQQASNGRMKLN